MGYKSRSNFTTGMKKCLPTCKGPCCMKRKREGYGKNPFLQPFGELQLCTLCKGQGLIFLWPTKKKMKIHLKAGTPPSKNSINLKSEFCMRCLGVGLVEMAKKK